MKRTHALPGIIVLAALSACSGKTGGYGGSAGQSSATPPPAAATPAAAPAPMDRAEKASGMLALVKDTPECQSWRDQLQAAGQVPADAPSKPDMAKILESAHEAGCSK